VRFGTSKEHVAFGFVIKDLRGQIVSSLESRKQYDYGEYLDVVDEGSVVEVVVTFPCLFANGDYYIDFGVSGFKGDQIVWARGVDLCMFRVINNRSYSVGFVDILSSMNVRRGEQVLLNVDRHIEVVEIGK
jgi:hypothetical protein